MINNGILLWGEKGGHEVCASLLKRDKSSIIHLQWISKEAYMNYQVNGEGYGLYKNVERHWISQILRNLQKIDTDL